MVLTREQRERLVLDLYNQGKNTREIAQEVRMSFSAIGAILKKTEQENETSKERTEKMSHAARHTNSSLMVNLQWMLLLR